MSSFLKSKVFVVDAFELVADCITELNSLSLSKIYHSDIEEIVAEDKRYDLITTSHVLEHLRDPREMLLKLGSLLKTGGRLYIEVPNEAGLLLQDCLNSRKHERAHIHFSH